jgi:hypothetical protein
MLKRPMNSVTKPNLVDNNNIHMTASVRSDKIVGGQLLVLRQRNFYFYRTYIFSEEGVSLALIFSELSC